MAKTQGGTRRLTALMPRRFPVRDDETRARVSSDPGTPLSYFSWLSKPPCSLGKSTRLAGSETIIAQSTTRFISAKRSYLPPLNLKEILYIYIEHVPLITLSYTYGRKYIVASRNTQRRRKANSVQARRGLSRRRRPIRNFNWNTRDGLLCSSSASGQRASKDTLRLKAKRKCHNTSANGWVIWL